MCLHDTTEIFLARNNNAQFDQKRKGLTDLGVKGSSVNDLFDMLARIIDVTNAVKKQSAVDAIPRFVTEVESGKRDRPTGYTLIKLGATSKDVDQLYGALKNAFNQVRDKRELSSRIRKEGGLFMAMLNAEKQAILDKENADALKLVSSQYDAVNTNVNKNTQQINAANTGLTNIAATQQNTAKTINDMLDYVKTEGKIWNQQSQTMLNTMNNMDNSLSKIDKHLDPSQYRE